MSQWCTPLPEICLMYASRCLCVELCCCEFRSGGRIRSTIKECGYNNKTAERTTAGASYKVSTFAKIQRANDSYFTTLTYTSFRHFAKYAFPALCRSYRLNRVVRLYSSRCLRRRLSMTENLVREHVSTQGAIFSLQFHHLDEIYLKRKWNRAHRSSRVTCYNLDGILFRVFRDRSFRGPRASSILLDGDCI